MEGPTPVSALIHAATMVTAGVYLIVRTHPIFEAAPDVQHLAAILGAVTLLVAGVIALVQWDIKRVIAYSTMSQIGYMFLGAGVGAYDFAMFHLMTHAFFKALLFLAAGIVIHHLAGEQDIRQMGGLKRYMPFTSIVFLIGTLALMGIPPLSGFWSKDAILASALATGGTLGWFLYVAGLVGAILTGMYALRLYLLVFHGEPSQCVLDHAGGHGEHDHGAKPLLRTEATRRGPTRCSFRWACLPCSPTIGGLVDIPGVYTGFASWISERCRAPRGAECRPGLRHEPHRGHCGRARRSRRLVRVQGRPRDRRQAGRPDACSSTSSTSTSCTTPSSPAPPRSSPHGCATTSSSPSCRARSSRSAAGTREAAGGVARLQTGLLRSYALVIAGSVAVLVIVFLAVR